MKQYKINDAKMQTKLESLYNTFAFCEDASVMTGEDVSLLFNAKVSDCFEAVRYIANRGDLLVITYGSDICSMSLDNNGRFVAYRVEV